MEEDKQKKRNKKKKKQQKKAAEDAAQASSQQQGNNASDPSHLTQHNESHNINESHSDGTSELPIENNGHHDADSNLSVLATMEKQDWIKEEARLNVLIKELQLEMQSRIQKEAELEMKLSKLQEEKDVSHQKETNLLEKVKLLERDKVLWVQEEDSSKQKIAALNDENARLRVQVMELEECGKKLSLEKKQLMEDLSTLQSRIEDLERISASAHSSVDITNDSSKIDDLNSQIEASCQLLEKLIAENADLVEKMNELYAELGRWQANDGDLAISMPDSLTVNAKTTVSHPVSVAGDEIANRSDKALIEEERLVSDHSDTDYSAVVRNSSDTSMSGEIVQIPLDENEARDLEGQVLVNEETDGVPLTDAPLIGAPFRIISFVAQYVSGADLVRDSSDSSQ